MNDLKYLEARLTSSQDCQSDRHLLSNMHHVEGCSEHSDP